MLTKTLLTPTEAEERYRSAGQIPLALQTWLTKTGKMSMDTTGKIGWKLHRIIVTSYQNMCRAPEVRRNEDKKTPV
jgi:hypothetical protein